MAKAHGRTEPHGPAMDGSAKRSPWLRYGLRLAGFGAVLLGGGSIFASFLPLPEAVTNVVEWYRSVAHPTIVNGIASVVGGGFVAGWAADAAVTAAGGALLAMARRGRHAA